MFITPKKQIKSSLVLLLLLSVIGCGWTGKERASKPVAKIDPKVLVNQDLVDLQNATSTGLQVYDYNNSGLITQIFGGNSSQNVYQYLATRLHYFVKADESGVGFTPKTLFDGNWLKDDGVESDKPQQKVEVGAMNYGVMFWLASQVNGTPANFHYHGSVVPITSTRIGVMVIGDGYNSPIVTSDRTYALPQAMRHATLIHEARHSDCTGGLKQSDLQVARNASNSKEFMKNYKGQACGHLHVMCPANHQYHGLVACDSESWGAYEIGSIYAKARSGDNNLDYVDKAILEAYAIDYASRTLVPRSGRPDMSSGGLVD